MFAALKVSPFLPRLHRHYQRRLLKQLRPANQISFGDELRDIYDKLLELSTSWNPTDIIQTFQLQRRRAALEASSEYQRKVLQDEKLVKDIERLANKEVRQVKWIEMLAHDEVKQDREIERLTKEEAR